MMKLKPVRIPDVEGKLLSPCWEKTDMFYLKPGGDMIRKRNIPVASPDEE